MYKRSRFYYTRMQYVFFLKSRRGKRGKLYEGKYSRKTIATKIEIKENVPNKNVREGSRSVCIFLYKDAKYTHTRIESGKLFWIYHFFRSFFQPGLFSWGNKGFVRAELWRTFVHRPRCE